MKYSARSRSLLYDKKHLVPSFRCRGAIFQEEANDNIDLLLLFFLLSPSLSLFFLFEAFINGFQRWCLTFSSSSLGAPFYPFPLFILSTVLPPFFLADRFYTLILSLSWSCSVKERRSERTECPGRYLLRQSSVLSRFLFKVLCRFECPIRVDRSPLMVTLRPRFSVLSVPFKNQFQMARISFPIELVRLILSCLHCILMNTFAALLK